MKKLKSLIKLFIATSAVLTIVATFGAITGFALDTGYRNAIDCGTNSGSVTGNITSADDSVWYKFTVPEPYAAYGFSLKNMPEAGMFSFELYYQENEDDVPKIYRMENNLNSLGNRNMNGVMKNAGTYYIRVFSYTGGSGGGYTFVGKIGYGAYSLSTTKLSSPANLDWAYCAEMAGKERYTYDFKNRQENTRTASNAAVFVQNNGTSDTGTPIDKKPENLDLVADAANYIYSGNYMITPGFAAEEKEYSINELLELLWEKRAYMIMCFEDINIKEAAPQIAHLYSKYALLTYVDPSTNKVGVIDPTSTASKENKIDYDELCQQGYEEDTKVTKYFGKHIMFK